MSELDLYSLVRDVCAESAAPDPTTLAKEVAGLIPAEQAMAALLQALPAVVAQVVSRQRSYTPPVPRDTPVTPGMSPKVAAIREAARLGLLRHRVAVGAGVWKFLGDCDAVDLRRAALVNEQQARANAVRAVQKRRLAEQLEQHRVATVAELPDRALAEALEATA